MVVLGLLLIGLGALAVLSALFVSSGTAEMLGLTLSSRTIFLAGVIAGACILWGFTILKYGTKREIRHRKERKELSRRSEKLDQVEAQRAQETDEPE
ncbi:MAG TPA: hypothetical protein VGJ41_15795 [Nocardioides sp.]|jgi:hypothetical protein